METGISGNVKCAARPGYPKQMSRNLSVTNMNSSDCPDDDSLLFALGGAFAGDVTRYVVFVIMLLFSIITVFGNVSIILCVVRSPHLNRSNYSIYVISLAVSDMIIGATCIPSLAVYTILGYWPLGSVTCTIFIICDFVCCGVSNLHLDMIAYDRYRAVSDPLTYRSKFTRSKAITIAAIAWLVCTLCPVPVVLVDRVRDTIQESTMVQQCYYPSNTVSIVLGLFLSTYGPLALLIILSICVVVTVKRRNLSQIISNTSTQREYIKTKNTSYKNIAVNLENEKIAGQNRRCLITLGAQVVLYLICWGPWMVVYLISQLCETCVPPSIYEIAYWMTYLNSTVNPILYLVFNKDYRNAFQIMFWCSRED